jgi:hypothetical protein
MRIGGQIDSHRPPHRVSMSAIYFMQKNIKTNIRY